MPTHYGGPRVFAVFCEQKNLDIQSGLHLLAPTSTPTTSYVHKAENVKVEGGIFAAGNGQDVEQMLLALPSQVQNFSIDG